MGDMRNKGFHGDQVHVEGLNGVNVMNGIRGLKEEVDTIPSLLNPSSSTPPPLLLHPPPLLAQEGLEEEVDTMPSLNFLSTARIESQ